jgi:hypothetical protein
MAYVLINDRLLGSYTFYNTDIPARLVGRDVNCCRTDTSFPSRVCHWVYTHVRHSPLALFSSLKWVMSV